MADKLLPCPFCGGEAKVVGGLRIIPILDSNGAYIDADVDEGWGYGVQCQSCYASIDEPWLSEDSAEVKKYDGDISEATYQSVVTKWNNRPSPWHTGTPTEEGWYLVAYECVYDCKNKGKIEYFTLNIITDEDGCKDYRGRASDDVWKAVAWQKIEED